MTCKIFRLNFPIFHLHQFLQKVLIIENSDARSKTKWAHKKDYNRLQLNISNFLCTNYELEIGRKNNRL